MLAAKKGERIRTFQYGLLPFIVVLAPLVALIFLEPNLSMALLVALLAGVVLFTAGARIGHFLAVGVVATPLLFGAVGSGQVPLARDRHLLNPRRAPVITLPFISYGRASLFVALVATGVLVSIGRGRRT